MKKELKLEEMQGKEKAFSSINLKSFLLIVGLLSVILGLSGALSYFIPQGAFERDAAGVIIDGTYQKGEVQGVAIWRILTAPVRVFFSSDALTIIFISLFLLIMSGVFNLLDKKDGIRLFIGKIVQKFAKRRLCFQIPRQTPSGTVGNEGSCVSSFQKLDLHLGICIKILGF